MQAHWYYLHTNGELIHKRSRPDEGDFVRKIWPLNLQERESPWIICIEAASLGANPERIAHLVEHWKLTDEDAQVFVDRVGMNLRMDGNQWMAAADDFEDLVVSQAGFGDTCFDALVDYAKQGLAA